MGARLVNERFPLSAVQQRMWMADQVEPGLTVMTMESRWAGPLRTDVLRAALTDVVTAHDALRTVFLSENGGQPGQVVMPPAPFELSEEDGKLDLSGPLVRVRVISNGPEDHVLRLSVHHIVFDGWSAQLLHHDLVTCYDARARGETPTLPVPAARLGEHALWEEEADSRGAFQDQYEQWEQRLKNAPAVLELPTDFPRPVERRHEVGVHTFAVTGEDYRLITAVRAATGATPSAIALSAFAAVLGRYTGSRDLLVGMPVWGRTRPEVENVVGCFINTVPVRVEPDPAASFGALLHQVQDELLFVMSYQDIAVDRLIERIRPERRPGYQPLIQVMFTFEELRREPLRAGGCEVHPLVEIPAGHTEFDLDLTVTDRGDELSFTLRYATDLFEPITAQRFAEQYRAVLGNACATPDAPLRDVTVLPPRQRRLLTEVLARGPQRPLPESTLHEQFEQQVASSPTAVALTEGDRRLTFDDVNRRANRLAHHLIGLGVRPDDGVAVVLPQGIDMVIALFGALKAGAAFVPLDPAQPDDRLTGVIRRAGIEAVIATAADAARFERVVAVDEPLPGDLPDTNPVTAAGPDHLAYIFHTSGSTGVPKGAMTSHRSALAFTAAAIEAYRMTPDDRFLQLAAVTFDVVVEEVFPVLLAGGTLVLPARSLATLTPDDLVELIAEQQVTVCELTPVYWHELVQRLSGTGGVLPDCFRLLLMGGERPVPETLRAWRGLGVPLIHVYGLTETAVTTTVHEDDDRLPTLPIGKPVANAQVYLLDDDFEPVAAGVPGELYIGGPGVGRGYVARPDLTAERFVPDPFAAAPGERLYRTGDLAKWTTRGDIEFLGRIDQQVKIRGHRVEPGEIESVLEQHPAVRQAFVTVVPHQNGDLLAAYVVCRTDIDPADVDTAELRRHAATQLPAYLVPNAFNVLDHLPRTTHGKTDVAALPPPQLLIRSTVDEPMTGAEQALAAVWAEVLEIDAVGPDDDFFQLGGHSLLGFRLTARIGDEFGIQLPLAEFYRAPTVRAMAERLGHATAQYDGPVAGSRTGVPVPMSSVQERMWFAEQLAPDSGTYNVALEMQWTGPLSVTALGTALSHVVARHEALRTVFRGEQGAPPHQVVLPAAEVPLSYVDARGDGDRRLREAVQRAGERRFDLGEPLLRAELVRTGDDEHTLVISVHHIVFDGWSATVFHRELAAYYEAEVRAGTADLPALPVQVGDHAVWERSAAHQAAIAGQAEYWAGHLADAPAVLELVADHPRKSTRDSVAGVEAFSVNGQRYRDLIELRDTGGHGPNVVALAVLAGVLARQTGADDMLIGMPVLGRTRPEVQNLIGCFINTVALRVRPLPRQPFHSLLEQTRAEVLAALANQDFAFDQVVDRLKPERVPGRHPLVQVLFSYEHATRTPTTAGDVTVTTLPESTATASEFELDVTVLDFGDELSITIQYDQALFEPVTVRRLAEQFGTLLDAATANPGTPLRDLPVLPPHQVAQLTGEFARGKAVPLNGTAHHMFEAVVARDPGRVAVVHQDRAVTYGELNRKANQLAHHLISIGVRPEDRVGVALTRSVEQVVALFAVLKSGAAFVPLDPAHPSDRLLDISGRCSTVATVVSRADSATFAGRGHVVLADEPLPGDPPGDNPPGQVVPDHLAYVISTSGSTGRPKAGMTTHLGLLSFVVAAIEEYGLGQDDRFTQLAPVAFDVMIEEVFPVLLAGGTLVLAPRDLSRIEPAELLDLFAEHQVTKCELIPAYWHELTNHMHDSGQRLPESFRLMIIGGDRHAPEAWQMWRRMGLPLLNTYGPSETSITNCSHLDRPDAPARRALPMGRPWPNNQIYLLDERFDLAGAGAVGELFIGGPGVGRGYLGDPALTARQFVPNPFARTPGERMYRTGDLGRWSADGTIEFVSRADRQIKIRGHRIEPGEVEAVLERHPAVKHAYVVAVRNQYLVAYVVADGDIGELDKHAASLLPGYLMPAAFVELDRPPLTPNGKIDTSALPEPALSHSRAPSRPMSDTEHRLAAIWAEVLRIDQAGPDDDFFRVGGHSLLSYRLTTRVREEFGVPFTLADFFSATTVSAMAHLLDDRLAAPAAADRVSAAESIEDILAAVEKELR
ncbi:hypothetical protein AOZ06_41515 [Kibdelosporangium phytohabitans]|uniref:Carrier domain-containing protein n=2 Tax=Kibdelosporangium phytohabitans TaxID=860235 RepID=A0A0N9ICS2_9PSEU|nr:hypothetical protein AOZ06_41515 [Kibdelosporangium phytohabitans]